MSILYYVNIIILHDIIIVIIVLGNVTISLNGQVGETCIAILSSLSIL